jgi:cation diffusion facilitator CzcD-associated flavoprotein CzcO
MPMREPRGSVKTGGRLSGEDVRQYMEGFAERFLKGKILFETEVLNIRRQDQGRGWNVLVRDRRTGTEKASYYSRVILCTGVSFVFRIDPRVYFMLLRVAVGRDTRSH